jgi:CxxC-x17-CxxC domain-containing protein
MEFGDRILKCVECGSEFVFTSGEQLFYSEKGFRNEPKRCKRCKASRPPRHGAAAPAPTITVTVCSQCGKETTVPFKLTQGRPVYCAQCYQQRRSTGI